MKNSDYFALSDSYLIKKGEENFMTVHKQETEDTRVRPHPILIVGTGHLNGG